MSAATTQSARQHGERSSGNVLYHLERKVRSCERQQDLSYTIVNETAELVPYLRGVLWIKGRSVQAVSGVPDVNQRAPLMKWFETLAHHLGDLSVATVVHQRDLPGDLQSEWLNASGGYLVAAPLKHRGEETLGMLFLGRVGPIFDEGELSLLDRLADAYAYALWALSRKAPFYEKFRKLFSSQKWRFGILLFALLFLAFFPVRFTVLAPAEVIADQPSLIRAPVNGVIEEVHVDPSEPVSQGAPIISFNREEIEGQLAVTSQQYQVALTEYQAAARSAVTDLDRKGDLAILETRANQEAAELEYLQSLAKRLEVAAPHDGIAIFSDPNALRGRPVRIGEAMMTIARPGQLALEILVPSADAIAFEDGAEIRFFADSNPGAPSVSSLTYAAPRASLQDDGSLSFVLKGAWREDQTLPRLGSRGVAKVYGQQTNILYLMFRRPLAWLRRTVGL